MLNANILIKKASQISEELLKRETTKVSLILENGL